MKRVQLCFAALSVMTAGLMVVASAAADPLPNRDILKFSQLPMVATPIPDSSGTVTDYFGHDELSTAYSVFSTDGQLIGYQGQFMADDFADRFQTPVVHVKWWGSYLNDEIIQPVDKFLISFESDIPAIPDEPDSFSRPGTPLLNQVVTKAAALSPGSGTYTEKFLRGPDPVVGESLYEYNAELHVGKEFFQQPDTVYWLKIVALVDLPPDHQSGAPVTQWGWHNRDYTLMDPLASTPPAVVPGEHVQGTLPGGTDIWHFQDDAVTGFVLIDATGPGGLIMPEIQQSVSGPTHYVDLADGPDGISQFSKDLAFELFTVPEPGAASLLALGSLLLPRRRRP